MNDKTVKTQKRLLVLLGMAVGIAVFLLLYGTAPLDVANDGWILNRYDENDVQQHYAGWLFFRQSSWSFPLGLADNLYIPQGTIISYTDSLPWVSILLKLVRGLLPATFQWFGWYTLLCFALQGAAGALLASRRAFTRSVAPWGLGLAGALIFCFNPILWERAFRHVALGSHYLYLFALYFYLQYRAALKNGTAKFPWQFALLAGLAIGIHPYYMALVLVCALLAAIDCLRCRKAPLAAAGQFALAMGTAVLCGLLLGTLGTGNAVTREGFGRYSMNLNALFNPLSLGGYTWSRLLTYRSLVYGGQYDGFNYLGLGSLALVALALVLAVIYSLRHRKAAAGWWRRNLPLLVFCGLLTLFAVSNTITWDAEILLELPLPAPLLTLCGIFRASSRMFYLVNACMLVFGIYTVYDAAPSRARWLPYGVLACLFALQAWDLSAVMAEKHAKFQEPVAECMVTDPRTQDLGQTHDTLLMVHYDSDGDWPALRMLTVLAGKQGLTSNLSIAVDQEIEDQSALQAQAQLAAGEYDPQTVYVTMTEADYIQWQQTFAGDETATLFESGNMYFLVPQG